MRKENNIREINRKRKGHEVDEKKKEKKENNMAGVVNKKGTEEVEEKSSEKKQNDKEKRGKFCKLKSNRLDCKVRRLWGKKIIA